MLENGEIRFDAAVYDHDIVFDELLTAVETKYIAIIEPNSSQVKILIRLQSAIEIISNILDQIEQLVKETFKITFTLTTIRNAILMINKELILIFQEVKDFYNSMKGVEIQNKNAFEMVKLLSKEIRNFEKSYFLIPVGEKMLLKENIQNEIPVLKQYLDAEITENDELVKDIAKDTLFGTSIMQILKLNDIFHFYNRLRSLHCEFSFLLLHIYFRDECPSGDHEDSSKYVKIPDSYLQDLLGRCVELAEKVFVKVNICRSNYCRVHKERKLLIDNYRKKQELQIQQLNNLQIILQVITELNNKHDALIGKLIKTTKLYDNVHAILEKPWHILKLDAGRPRFPNEFAVKPISRVRPSIISLSTVKSMLN